MPKTGNVDTATMDMGLIMQTVRAAQFDDFRSRRARTDLVSAVRRKQE